MRPVDFRTGTSKTLDVVSPIYNASTFIERFVRAITALQIPEFDKLNLVLVDDGSTDDTLEKLYKIASGNHVGWDICVLSLARNRGQHAATKAGLQISNGDYVVVMDCDFEHDPLLIPLLTQEALNKRVDVVFTRFTNRSIQRSLSLKILGSKLFSHIYKRLLSNRPEFMGISTFRLITRKIVLEALENIELEDYSGLVTANITNNYAILEFKSPMEDNGSRYSLASRLDLFLRFLISRVPQFSIGIVIFSSVLFLLTISYFSFLMGDIVFFGGGLNPGINQVVVLLCLALSSILFFGGLLLFAAQYIVILLKRNKRIEIESIRHFGRSQVP